MGKQGKKGHFHQLVLLLVSTMGLFILIQVAVSICFGNQKLEKEEIGKLQRQISKQNEQLETTITRQASFAVLAQRAQDAGFTSPQKVVYFDERTPIAFNGH